MPRRPKAPLGPSRLSQILQVLKKEPRPQLDTVKSLKLTLAFRNDHFGARYVGLPAVALSHLAAHAHRLSMHCRHFVKEDLRRIRFVNPNMDIQVNKIPKSPEEKWPPEMQVEFRE